MTKNSDCLLIDCLEVTKPVRERFQEWRNGGLDCVHVTLSIWENARETLSTIGQWNRIFAKNSDLIAWPIVLRILNQLPRLAEQL